VLETVGAGAELVDGAAAGAELGGASVAGAAEPADELPEPDPAAEPVEPDPRPALGEPVDPELRRADAAGWPDGAARPGCPVGCALVAARRAPL
jgi:hypothetical protein